MSMELIKNYLPILAVILTSLFGLMSMYFYFKSKIKKNAIAIYTNSILQTKSHSEVIITYRNEKIENLSKLQLLFLNNGQIEIRANDIPALGKLSFKFGEDVKILSSVIKDTSEKAINFGLNELSTNEIGVNFDYLNPGDGAFIEVLYDREDEQNHRTENRIPFEINGSLIGVKKIDIIHYSNYKAELKTIPEFIVFGILFAIFVGSAINLFRTNHYIWGGICSYLSAAMVYYIINSIYKNIKNKVPTFARLYFK